MWTDIIFVHGTWTWSEVQEAPDWVVRRAILWADVLGEWSKAEVEKAKAR